MTGSGQQPNKQATNKQTDSETHLKIQKDIPKNRGTSRHTVDTRTEGGKQKVKNEALCYVVIKISE